MTDRVTEAVAAPRKGAIEPGAPVAAGEIPLCVPHLAGRETEYVTECLASGWVSSVGPFVTRFEKELAQYVGVDHAIATSSGTAALHVALLVAGVEPDDEVVMPSLTFIAPANAVRYAGAWPVFVDADSRTWQMSASDTDRFLRLECERDTAGVLRNRETKRRIGALLPVHILGHPVDLDAIENLASEFRLPIVEDATEALGAMYRGRAVGSTGRLSCFSFNGNKLITTGGGGMVVCGDAVAARRARYLTTQAKDDPIEFVHNEIGFNYRLSNVLAALGVAQLEQLSGFVAKKRAIAARYASAFADIPGLCSMPEADWARSAFWMYTVLLDRPEWRDLNGRLADVGIQTRPLWQPLHLSPAHAASPRRPCPVAESLVARALSLPCSVGLTDDEQYHVIESVRGAMTARPRA